MAESHVVVSDDEGRIFRKDPSTNNMQQINIAGGWVPDWSATEYIATEMNVNCTNNSDKWEPCLWQSHTAQVAEVITFRYTLTPFSDVLTKRASCVIWINGVVVSIEEAVTLQHISHSMTLPLNKGDKIELGMYCGPGQSVGFYEWVFMRTPYTPMIF